jgi:7-carboxy-7-deazaguanine synthase
MSKLLVNSNPETLLPSIFQTIQGEGIYSGVPSFFIRLQGCKVHCHFCDEKETWTHRAKNSVELSPTEILFKLETLNPLLKRLVITGGEPCEQSLYSLITALQANSYCIAIESSGTGEKLHELFQDYKDPLWITFSPKEPYSQNGSVTDLRIWQKASELKFVIASEKAEEYLLRKIIPSLQEHSNPCPVFLVPDWFRFEENKKRVLDLCMKFPNRFRLGVQVHKYLDLE